MQTIAVTGVAGALGARCLLRLSEQDHVRIIGVDKKPLGTSAPRLHFEHGDLSTIDLKTLFSGVDVVLHLASADTDDLRRVLEACAAAKVRQFVTLSSAAVFGAWRTNPVPLAEDAPLRPNPEFPYAATLAERERVLQSWSADHLEVKVALLRMAMIVGAKGGTSWINALGGIGLHQHGNGDRPVQFLHIEDAVGAIDFVIRNELSGVFNVAPANFIGDATAKAVAGVQPRPPLPRRIAAVVNRALWRRTAEVDFDRIRPYLEYPWVMSSDRLRKAGWNSSYSSEEALVASESPTWWGSLRPGQRRSFLGLVSFVATLAGMTVWAMIGVLLVRRRMSGGGTLRS